MASYILQVPLIGQSIANTGTQPLPFKNGFGFNACWYAAACMVAYYHEVGPRFGLPNIWAKDLGLEFRKISKLARNEGLEAVPRPQGEFNGDAWISLLKKHGPIWAAGEFGPNGGMHAIVVTGVRDGIVLYNDPWEPAAKQRPAQALEYLLLDLPDALLVKSTTRKATR
jgi:Papain-like cysteine protease AvrRpt2